MFKLSGAKQLLEKYTDMAEKVLVEFAVSEKTAIEMLEVLKAELSKKHSVSGDETELFEACVYNVLATINTVPCQTKKSGQLIAALTEAKAEMQAIGEMLL